MVWTSYHTHCDLCDGKATLAEFARAAADQGMLALGFSSHAPVPFETEWTMSAADQEAYCDTVAALREEYKGLLRVHLGLEIDYIAEKVHPGDELWASWGLEYVIGSVHFVDVFEDGTHWGIDSSPELFARGLKEVFDGDIRHAVRRYYTLVREMLETSPPDIVGHIDVIKKFNRDGQWFDDSDEWYRAAALEALEAVQLAGSILEVNTGHLARDKADEPYPAPWLLEHACEMDIPITLSADAHRPEKVTGKFEETARMLLDTGFTELMIIEDGLWIPREFDASGLKM